MGSLHGRSDGDQNTMRLAIVHDYLIQMGGAERVVAAMAEAFPSAPIITSVTDTNTLLPELSGHREQLDGCASRDQEAFQKIFPAFPDGLPVVSTSGC
jgi:hypothetical protein